MHQSSKERNNKSFYVHGSLAGDIILVDQVGAVLPLTLGTALYVFMSVSGEVTFPLSGYTSHFPCHPPPREPSALPPASYSHTQMWGSVKYKVVAGSPRASYGLWEDGGR